MAIDKWKTYPCKLCLLKGKCLHRCFQYPEYRHVVEYVQDTGLSNTCLGCGSTWDSYIGVNTYVLDGNRGCKGECSQCSCYHSKNERTYG